MQKTFGKLFRINHKIDAQKVRVIDHNSAMLGVITLNQAMELAKEAGLDLVEVSPNVNPPVCKIANFGKMKYEMQKKANDAKKKQKLVETKEVKLSLNIGKGDYDVKLRRVAKFIEDGDKVKISMRMKGREMTHLNLAYEMISDVKNDTEEFAKFESEPKMEGRQMIGILVKK